MNTGYRRKKRNNKVTIIKQPARLGFDIICFDNYMFAATKFGEFLPVEKRVLQIGKFELVPEQSNITRIGNGGSAAFSEILMVSPASILYLGVFPNARVNEITVELAIFQQLEAGKPRQFQKNLFGIENADEYENFLVCAFLIKGWLGITTRNNASRIYKTHFEFEPL